MTPSHAEIHRAASSRRGFLQQLTAGAAMMGATHGCSGVPSIRSQSPEEPVADLTSTRLIGDIAVPFGTYPIRVEAVGLVTGLPGTGSDPPPSMYRGVLLAEMQAKGVRNPNQILADPSTELVLVRGFMRPGIQKGDRFDVEVRVPDRNTGGGLRGGWLMETRLAELAVLDGAVRDGKPMALVDGPILVDPSAGTDDPVRLGRGRILGRATSVISRPVGLVLRPDSRSVRNSKQAGDVINSRFHVFDRGIKQGVATPKTDEFVELAVHPRYKDNIERYIQVLRSLPLAESTVEQSKRLKLLEQQLLDPITSSRAALRLEAISRDAVPVLKKGLESKQLEVRFFSAEALAYLDEPDAAAPLAEAARTEPAFRAFALAALSAMDDYSAFEVLRDMLGTPSAETRYGAFRAIWANNPSEPVVKGENLGGAFSYHVLACDGPPMVHVTRSYRAEVVLFGKQHPLKTPFVIEAGPEILVTAHGGDKVTVSRFRVDAADQKRFVTPQVDEIIRAIIDLGGTYPDVVGALQQAKDKGVLASRLEIDALPQPGRSYERGAVDTNPASAASEAAASAPTPSLFEDTSANASDDASKPAVKAKSDSNEGKEAAVDPEAEKTGPFSKLFAKIPGDDEE